MPGAIIIGGPLDGQRVNVSQQRPRFLEVLDDKGATQMHFEVDVSWCGQEIEEPVFVHHSIHNQGFNLMAILLAGYRRPGP